MNAAYKNFTGGEVTPTIAARYDLNKAGSFLSCCENFIPNLHGDVERRPGTKYITNLNGMGFLIPFSFNNEAENNYVLIFMDSGIYVATENGPTGAVMTNPYGLWDVPKLSYAQTGDILYLAHKNYELRKITRSGSSPYTWAIETVVFNQCLPKPTITSISFNRGCLDKDHPTTPYMFYETYTLKYKVTAVDDNGVESLASTAYGIIFRYPSDWVSGDYIELGWGAITGAKEYNIYRESAGYYGYIGTSNGLSFKDENYIPDTSHTPKENWKPFKSGNNPNTVAFHQQRLVIGGTKKNPATIYMSRAGDFENFQKSFPVMDDDPIEYMLASGSIDEIQWIASFGELLVGTAGCEYKIDSSGPAITPTDVQISTQSFWGSAKLKPVIIGNSILHCQRNGNHVRDLHYSWETDGYKGNDLSILTPNLVDGYSIVQWAFQQSPGNNIWIVRNDGTLLCLTYMQEQNIFSWSRHTTKGSFRSCAVISGNGEDVLMLVTSRWINGAEAFFLERLSSRISESTAIEDAFFVDCGVTKTSATDTVNFSGIGWLCNQAVDVLSEGSPEVGHSIDGGGNLVVTYPTKKVQVGLHYDSVICPFPLEADTQQGSSLTNNRGYGKVTIRVLKTVDGKYAATREGDLFNSNAWTGREFYDIPFLPENYNRPCVPFSGDIDIMLPSGKDPDTSIWLKQDKPLPFRLNAIVADINF